MNKKRIFKYLLSASIIGVAFISSPMKTNAEWRKENNSWKYIENNKHSVSWNYYDSKWYYFNNDGIMQTGWVKDRDNWYYLSEAGDMQTGWVKDKDSWYYLSESGSMKTGWVKHGNDWYYLSEAGDMKTGWVKDKDLWYYLSESGSMQTGVISVSDKVYYLNENGAMHTGKITIDGKEYEFGTSGEAIGEKPVVKNDKMFGATINAGSQNNNQNKDENKDSQTSNSNKHHSSNSGSTIQNKKWNLVWQDDFNGDTLNTNDWNYEKHAPGWVNSELQEYTDSTDNISVKDGNLVIKAIKKEKDGKDYYTSGKITTQDKKTFKYGKFEIRAKTPKGKGLWPALWMMPNDESLYGQWPKCGEIDIMEVLGHEPEKAYGTIHYGEPHAEQQGTYTLENGTFADDYHTYSVEWEPGEIRFYIDGNLYHKVNDWFTKVEGGDEVTYPAPFDQPFYLQCNLAVGGSWPGNPDENTDFNNAELKVDYVKVYQKDSYDENVKKPEKNVVFREPDKTGNYVVNGDFSKQDDKNWEFKTALNGLGSTEIADNKILIKTENEGTADYSIQLVQPGVPLKEGGKYKVSFDAKADDERTMIVDISGPDKSYVRYFDDTKLNLTSNKENYSYEFTMNKEDDANARLEFNLGNQNSKANVEISNVRIEKIGQVIKDDDGSKKVMPDGNYVNNGTFDVGEDRMKYWEIESSLKKDASVSVTNNNNVRQLKINVKKSPSSLEDLKIKQSKLALKDNKQYVLYFDAYANEDKTIKAMINGKAFDANLSKGKKTFKFEFNTENVEDSRDLEFLLGAKGTTYIDNIRIEENALIRNGDFSGGFTGWQIFADGGLSSKPTYGVDSLKEDNAAQINIVDTGDADWKIQLKQNNVKLEKGKKYELSFDAKSTVDRKIMYAIQRDGSSDNNWDAYTGSNIINLTSDSKNYKLGFEMKKDTDSDAIFSISMGAVGGTQITDKHTVTIDNVQLKEVDSIDNDENNSNDDTNNNTSGSSIVNNGDFGKGFEGWSQYVDESIKNGATFNSDNNQANINITNSGDQDYKVQLKQENVKLEKGKKYKVSLDAKSTLARDIKFTVQKNGGDWKPYCEVKKISLNGELQNYSIEFTMNDESDDKAALTISMGEGNIIENHTITIDNVNIEEVTSDSQQIQNQTEDIANSDELVSNDQTNVVSNELTSNDQLNAVNENTISYGNELKTEASVDNNSVNKVDQSSKEEDLLNNNTTLNSSENKSKNN